MSHAAAIGWLPPTQPRSPAVTLASGPCRSLDALVYDPLMRSLCGYVLALVVAACTGSAPARQDPPAGNGVAADSAPDPKRFEPEIRAFEAADRSRPPLRGGVVFIGSSSIRNWTNVAADFPGVPILNRGFGGSLLADVVYYEDRVLL